MLEFIKIAVTVTGRIPWLVVQFAIYISQSLFDSQILFILRVTGTVLVLAN